MPRLLSRVMLAVVAKVALLRNNWPAGAEPGAVPKPEWPQPGGNGPKSMGNVALGQALGATGAILLSTLIDGHEQTDLRTGLVVAFAASGIGAAMIVRRL